MTVRKSPTSGPENRTAIVTVTIGTQETTRMRTETADRTETEGVKVGGTAAGTVMMIETTGTETPETTATIGTGITEIAVTAVTLATVEATTGITEKTETTGTVEAVAGITTAALLPGGTSVTAGTVGTVALTHPLRSANR